MYIYILDTYMDPLARSCFALEDGGDSRGHLRHHVENLFSDGIPYWLSNWILWESTPKNGPCPKKRVRGAFCWGTMEFQVRSCEDSGTHRLLNTHDKADKSIVEP